MDRQFQRRRTLLGSTVLALAAQSGTPNVGPGPLLLSWVRGSGCHQGGRWPSGGGQRGLGCTVQSRSAAHTEAPTIDGAPGPPRKTVLQELLLLLLLLLSMDFGHLGGKHPACLLKLRVVACALVHAEKSILGGFVHVQVFDELAGLQAQVVVLIHVAEFFEDTRVSASSVQGLEKGG